MSSFHAIALASAAILCVSSADAATIVQSRDTSGGNVAFFDRFDTRLGTLQSVTVDAAYRSVFFFRYPEQSGNPPVSAFGSIGASDGAILNFNGLYNPSRYNPSVISIFVTGMAQGIYTGDLSRYVGAGMVVVGAGSTITAAIAGAPIERVNPPVTGQGSSSFTITYDYTPAIPEPTTWALMLAGFGMVGYALRRRRVGFTTSALCGRPA